MPIQPPPATDSNPNSKFEFKPLIILVVVATIVALLLVWFLRPNDPTFVSESNELIEKNFPLYNTGQSVESTKETFSVKEITKAERDRFLQLPGVVKIFGQDNNVRFGNSSILSFKYQDPGDDQVYIDSEVLPYKYIHILSVFDANNKVGVIGSKESDNHFRIYVDDVSVTDSYKLIALPQVNTQGGIAYLGSQANGQLSLFFNNKEIAKNVEKYKLLNNDLYYTRNYIQKGIDDPTTYLNGELIARGTLDPESFRVVDGRNNFLIVNENHFYQYTEN